MHRCLVSIIPLIFLFTSCATVPTKPKPVWVGAVGGPFTNDGIEGIGFGSYRKKKSINKQTARNTAYNDALQKLALRLESTVKGEVKTILKDRVMKVTGGKIKEVSEETLESTTKSIFDIVLGKKFIEEYHDEKKREWWVLCWMDREEAERTILEVLAKKEKTNQSNLKSAIKTYEKAKNLSETGNLISGIILMDNSLDILTDIVGITEFNGVNNISLMPEIKVQKSSILSSVYLEKLSNNLQAAIGGKIKEPIGIQVKYHSRSNDIPAKNMPVIFDLLDTEGKIDRTIRTNKKGKAYCNVYRIDSLGNAEILVRFNMDVLIKESPSFEALKSLNERFIISVLDKEAGTRIFVQIDEKNIGETSNNVENVIIEKLSERGYSIVNEKQKVKADLMILGRAVTEHVGRAVIMNVDLGESCRASVNIQIVEQETEKIIATKSETSIKGFGLTKEEAGADALRKTAEFISEYIIKQINKMK